MCYAILPRGVREQLSRILPRSPCYFETDRSFGRFAPSKFAWSAWRRSYSCFYSVDDSCGEQIRHTGRDTRLGRFADSGQIPREYSLASRFVEYNQLPVKLSASSRISHLSVGCKVTSEADLHVHLVRCFGPSQPLLVAEAAGRL